MSYEPKRTEYGTGDRRWLPDMLSAQTIEASITTTDVTPADGVVKSGRLVPGKGLVLNDTKLAAGQKAHVALVNRGNVDRRYLPVALTLAQETALRGITFVYGAAPV